MTTPTGRAPVLLVGRSGGVELEEARATRIRLDDGLLLHESPAGTRTLATAAEITRAVVLGADQQPAWARRHDTPLPQPSESLVLLAGERPALFVRLRDHSPSRAVPDDAALREVRVSSAACALARGLGLQLEEADEADLALLDAARDVALLLPAGGTDRPHHAWLIPTAGGVATFVAWTLGGGLATLLLAALVGVALAPLTAKVVRLRHRFPAAADSLPPLPGAVVLAPAAAPTHGLAAARLLVSPARIVLHDRGGESTALGPALGGVTHATLEEVVRLHDADGVRHLHLDRTLWAGTPQAEAALVSACEAAGMTTTVLPPLAEVRVDGDEAASLAGRSSVGLTLDRAAQTGAVHALAPWLLLVAWSMLTVAGVQVAGVHAHPAGWALLVPAAVVVALLLRGSLRVARWDRHQRRRA